MLLCSHLDDLDHEEERDGESEDDQQQRHEGHELGEHPRPLLTTCCDTGGQIDTLTEIGASL